MPICRKYNEIILYYIFVEKHNESILIILQFSLNQIKGFSFLIFFTFLSQKHNVRSVILSQKLFVFKGNLSHFFVQKLMVYF